MARWRLTAPHYLNVKGTKWEYSEVDRITGKPKRIQFDVPMLLDPDQPADWNIRIDRDTGEIVVSNGGECDPRDIIFTGDPTPDMVPLDAEAEAISAKLAKTWKHPIETLSGKYSDTLVQDFQAQLADVQSKQSANVKVDGMTDLLAAMTAMMKQNQDLIAALAAKPEATHTRRA